MYDYDLSHKNYDQPVLCNISSALMSPSRCFLCSTVNSAKCVCFAVPKSKRDELQAHRMNEKTVFQL